MKVAYKVSIEAIRKHGFSLRIVDLYQDSMKMKKSIAVFISYAHEDEILRKELEKHLSVLKQQELIAVWHDREISAGKEWKREIDKYLQEADIILILVSAAFINSQYCYGIEMKQALDRHQRGEARVIPIILRPTIWEETPLSELQALPTDARPITDPDWPSLDAAFYDIVRGLRKVMEELTVKEAVSLRAPPSGKEWPNLAVPPSEQSFGDTQTLALASESTTAAAPQRFSRRAVLWGIAGVVGATLTAGSAWFLSSRSSTTYHPHDQHSTSLLATIPTGTNVLDWSPDGKYVAYADGQVVRVWSVAEKKDRYVYKGHSSFVFGLAWSPDSKRIASTGQDLTVQVWDATDGGHLFTHRGPTYFSFTTSVSWSPDGKRIASCVSGESLVEVWDAANGGHLYRFDYREGLSLGYGPPFEVQWAPRGNKIASVASEGVDLFVDGGRGDFSPNYYSGPTAAYNSTSCSHRIAWSPDAQLIVIAGGRTNIAQVWDATTDAGAAVVTYTSRKPVNSVTWAPGGKYIASAGDDHTVQIWHAGDGSHVMTYTGHKGPVNLVAWSPVGTAIASASSTIQIWTVTGI
jgi:WD40 repeat protein